MYNVLLWKKKKLYEKWFSVDIGMNLCVCPWSGLL